jgi:hypothetical protein
MVQTNEASGTIKVGFPMVFPFIIGQWYLFYTCHYCRTKQVLLRDPTEGKAYPEATYAAKCDFCSFEDQYDGATLEHYQHAEHPPSKIGIVLDCALQSRLQAD